MQVQRCGTTLFGKLLYGLSLCVVLCPTAALTRMGVGSRTSPLDAICLGLLVIMSPLQYWEERPKFVDAVWRSSIWGFLLCLLADLLWAHGIGGCGRSTFTTVLLYDVLPQVCFPVALWYLCTRGQSYRSEEPSAAEPDDSSATPVCL